MAILVAAPLASASLVEDLTGMAYQRDGGIAGDAPDSCAAPRMLPFPIRTEGLVVAEDDIYDYYAVDVPASRVGKEMHLHVDAWARVHPRNLAVEVRPDVDLYVYPPGCGTPLAHARTYNGTEHLIYKPQQAGRHVVLVLLYAPVADLPFLAWGPPVPASQLGYDFAIE